MRTFFSRVALAALLLATPLTAYAADNITITQGSGTTMKTKDVGAGVEESQVLLSDSAGLSILGTAGSANSNVLTIQGIASGTAVNVAGVITPTSASSGGITPIVSSAAESNHVLKASAGNLYGLYVVPTVSGYLMVFNATSAPVDGAVTPAECIPAAAGSATYLNYGPGPAEVFSTGITAVFSTTGCFTKTASATAFFHGSVQ